MIPIYDEKSNMNTKPEIPSTSKVTGNDMNQLREAVLEGVYNDATNEKLLSQAGEELNPKIQRYEQGLFYKNSETKTGEKWIDGKPIYCRVIQSTVDQIQNVVNSLNIDTLIFHYGFATSQFDNEWPIPNVAATESNYNIMFFRDTITKNFAISFNAFYPKSNPVLMILKYTKTTD